MPESVSTRPLLDKLGVRPGARVAVVDLADPGFIALLRERTPDVALGRAPADCNLIFLGADSVDQLLRLGMLRDSLVPDGAIWVVSRKGRAATLRDVDVMDAARWAGLVDNKVVSFSATHTALRLVIPRELRPRGAR